MEPDFWHSRWKEGRIGFHEGKPNAHLVKHLAVLGTGKRVFVPLCGKTEDLAFLAAGGHQVVGVELVEDAVRAFFDEHGVQPVVSRVGPFTRYAAQNLALFAGDFFASTTELMGPLDALYDRAALIALPPEMRGNYVKHLRSLLSPGAAGLVITVEYPQEQMQAPPFSVPEEELRAHFAGASIARVEQVKAEGPRLTPINALEKCFAISLPLPAPAGREPG
jgi:thiopurine S-methyltransferase